MSDRAILKIGHRGACGYEPENTLRSFRKAIELGVDMIEFDVHKCLTGELVIIHDETVDRTTNGQGEVMKKTLKELKELDAGQGERIPTLKEALALIDKKTQVNVELKGIGTAKSVADLIRKLIQDKRWKKEDFLVSSFDHPELREFFKNDSDIPIAILFEDNFFPYLPLAEELKATAINIPLYIASQKYIQQAHQAGLKVNVWTVNTARDIRRLYDYGVDGIISNYPDRLNIL